MSSHRTLPIATVMPLSPLIKKSFDVWINSDTWCTGHACDKARFYTFVWNVVRYSRKRPSECNLKALILERWVGKWDSDITGPKAQAQQQKKIDEANGYKLISLIDFKLDAKSMKKGTKVLMQGYLEVEGEMISLSDFMPLARIPNKLKVYLLTDNSPREVRQKLLEFKPSSCSLFAMCKPLVLGHVSKCTQTFAGKKIGDTFCLEVDEIRRESPNYN